MMDRMFEQSQKLINDQFTFATAQATRLADLAVAQGEKLFKVGGELVGNAVKDQTALFETLSQQAAAVSQQAQSLAQQAQTLVQSAAQQAQTFFTDAFKGAKA